MIKFKGVMPALVTPLNSDETVNVSALRKLISALEKQGADGFYIGGATGEGILLPRETREVLAEEAIKAIGKDKAKIVHIASAVFSETIALAKQAEKAGADAISAIPPIFFKYDEDDVYEYYKAIASAVHIPVIVYYNPAAGFNVNAQFAARVFEIDNVTGIKWTSSDYYGMMRLKELTHGEMNIINGPDQMLLMGLSAGADGGIGTTYNIMFPLFRKIYDSFVAGEIDKARELQIKTDGLIETLLKYKLIPATKAVLECQGFDVGNAAFPLAKYSNEMKKKIYADMVKAGL